MVLGRYNEGNSDEEVYLKGFSLEPIDRHRVGEGSMSTPAACIAGLWLTQPDKLERLLAERDLSDGGLLPRLLLMNLSCPPLRIRLRRAGYCCLRAKAFTPHSSLPCFKGSGRVIKNMSSTPLSKRIRYWWSFSNRVADQREADLHDITSFAARWGEYAWRLALVVHAARLGARARTSSFT